MRQFYISNLEKTSSSLTLSKEESRHIAKVLRMQIGDKIEILNGKGLNCEAEITDNNPKATTVKIVKCQTIAAPKQHIHIAIAPTKNRDRLEWFIEKSTEIGVHEITLILCDNVERKTVNQERLEKIIISAFKQSKRNFIPKLNALTNIKQFIKNNPKALIAHCYKNNKGRLKDNLSTSKCTILIGPEGDFTEDEVQFALENNYTPVSLGQHRLRTETAGIFACTAAKLLLK